MKHVFQALSYNINNSRFASIFWPYIRPLYISTEFVVYNDSTNDYMENVKLILIMRKGHTRDMNDVFLLLRVYRGVGLSRAVGH